MATMQDFITTNAITMTAEPTDRNPHMDGGQDMDHWRCVIRHGRRSMVVVFSKGVGHHGAEPTAAEVLDCLASDASGAENARSFEEWCSEYGYDTDSRKAERTYKTIERQAARLKEVIGDAGYDELLWNTERM